MGGKFEISAGKHCWKLADRLFRDGKLARLEVLVGRLTDSCWYGWGRQLIGCCRFCGKPTTDAEAAFTADANKKSHANANGNAQQRCMFESPVKQSISQSPEGARWPVAIVFYSYSPKGVIYLAQPTPYRLKIANFVYPLSFSAVFRGDPLGIYGKALLILKLESSRQPMVTI